MSQKYTPSKDDVAIFRESVGDIKHLKSDKILPDGPKPAPHPRQKLADEARVMREILDDPAEPDELQAGDTLNFRRPIVQNTLLRKLRRGQFRIADELDLHGMNATEAKHALVAFIQTACTTNARCVRIIHGKGCRSSNHGPVLKPLVNRWLRQIDEVLAFCSARPVDGGTGAVYVLLKHA
jgi:DNA-nicking Smr family endonuclease